MYLDRYINEINSLCDKHKVKHLFVFGSVLTEKFTDQSDIDFIADIQLVDPIEYAENYFEFKFQLEDLLNRPIDLLEERGVKNSYLRKRIDKTKKVIYEA